MADEGGYKGGAAIAATVVGLLLPITAVILRLSARKIYSNFFELLLEDYLIGAALIFKIGLDIAGSILLENGLGKHVTSVPPADLIVFAKTQYSGSYLYPLCITCVKLSVLVQYKRMFSDGSRAFRWQIYILMAIVVLWCLSIIIVASMLCIPLEKLWDPLVPGTCIPLGDFYYGLQVPNVVTDVFMIVCPIRMILTLNLPRRLQVAAIAMFLLGISTLVFDIIRLIVMVQLSESPSKDFTYDQVDAAVWTTLEPAIAIVTVCIPSIRSLHRNATARHSRHSQRQETTGRTSSVGSKMELHQTGSSGSRNSYPDIKRASCAEAVTERVEGDAEYV